MLFNIFTIDIDSGTEYTVGMFADNTKLSGAVDTIQGRDTIQRGLDVLKKCAHENLMRFNKAKCKVMLLDRGIPRYECRLGAKLIKSSPAKKDLRILVNEELAVCACSLEGPTVSPGRSCCELPVTKITLKKEGY